MSKDEKRKYKKIMELGLAATCLGGGFFGGIIIGYALKKVAYLQYQGIASMNWNKLQIITEGAAQTIINASQNDIPGVVTQHGFDSWGLPLSGA